MMQRVAIISLAVVLGTCSKPPTALEEVLQSGQLRVLTRNSPTTYYRGATGYDGPEFQLVSGFAAFLTEKYQQPVEANFKPVDSFPELLPSLARGGAHLAAAGLTVTEERARQVDFGPSYQKVRQQLIYKLNSGKPRKLADLRGKSLEIMAGTSYISTLHDMKLLEPQLRWDEKRDAEISELLVAVENKEIDYTVADSNEYRMHRYYMPELRIAMNLTDENDLAWAFGRYRSSALQNDAQEYFRLIKSNGTLTQLLDRYYGHTNEFDYVGTRTFIRHIKSRLIDYRGNFEQAGTDTDIDWRLLAAIGYQESHWRPDAVSPTGVRGLMMLTQTTASHMGVEDREDPTEAIPAGARYFAQLKARLSDIPEPDRTWFALAAYNVGYGHLQDARTLTKWRGDDPNRWLDVRDVLPLLAQQAWYKQVPHGYARGWEPVQYVDNVRTYYEILNWITQEEKPGETMQAEKPQDAKAGSGLLRWL